MKLGMYVDFAILNEDIIKVNKNKLLQTEAELTVVDGKVQYANKHGNVNLFNVSCW